MRERHSFDIFDTLIARRCIEPVNVFREIEAAIRVPGFAGLRIEAEAIVGGKPYTLDDIYQAMQSRFGMSKDVADILKAKEIEFEMANAIGVRQNIDMVKSGDVLVTDMYLPPYVIRALLDKAGLKSHVGLVVSSGGKHTGDVWPKLRRVAEIQQHTGDNEHTDVASPLAAGLFAEPNTVTALSLHEIVIRSNGFEHLARVMREVRLTQLSVRQEHEVQQQILLQINSNIPILLLTAVHLKRLCAQEGITNILFSSRDCFYLSKLFELLNRACGWNIPSEYFYTSRYSRVHPSPSYLHYFKERARPTSLVVDLCGTGWSLSHLYKKAGVLPRTFLLHYRNDALSVIDEYNTIKAGAPMIEPLSMIAGVPLNNMYLEVLNYIDCGMAMDVRYVEGYSSMVPVFEDPEYPPKALTIIERIEATQTAFREALGRINLDAMVREIEGGADKIVPVILELYQNLCQKMQPMQDLDDYSTGHNRKSTWMLKERAK